MFAATKLEGGNTEPSVSVNHFGAAKDSVSPWTERKHMPAYKIGTLGKFELSEIDAWAHVGGANEPDPNGIDQQAQACGEY